jgi:hypothetical protein
MRYKMQLPGFKNRMNKQLKHKICREPGCGKEYMGHAISKYCEFHSDPKKRLRVKRKYYDETNQPVRTKCPKDGDTIDIEFVCALEGCNERFRFKQFPNMKVTPRYCDEHRNEYKRQYFTRMLRKKAA